MSTTYDKDIPFEWKGYVTVAVLVIGLSVLFSNKCRCVVVVPGGNAAAPEPKREQHTAAVRASLCGVQGRNDNRNPTCCTWWHRWVVDEAVQPVGVHSVRSDIVVLEFGRQL